MQNLYALNNHNLLVKASESNKSDGDFFCPACNDKMGLKKGKVRTHHFYHITKACSEETYLHKTAKKLLFDNLQKYKNTPIDKEFVYTHSESIKYEGVETHVNVESSDRNIQNDTDRVIFLLRRDLLMEAHLDIDNHKKHMEIFFKKVKASENKELIAIFIRLHKWLTAGIDEAMKARVVKESSYREWNELKKMNSLIDNIVYLYKHTSHYHRRIFTNFKTYFRKLTNNEKELIVKYLYKPSFYNKRKGIIVKEKVQIGGFKSIYLDDKKYKGFLADILTFDNNNIPTFWEIAVTHKCEEKKIESGIRIIEIEVQSKEDLERIANFDFSNMIIDIYNP